MKAAPKQPHVAILVGTARDWGRNLVKGILSYTDNVAPWHVQVTPNVGGHFDALPKGWNGDGVIGRITSPKLAKQLTESDIPVVNVADTKLTDFSAPCVRTDDIAATRMAAQHFIDRGFRNMAIVGARHRSTPLWYADAFEQALAEHDLPCNVFPMKENDPDLKASLAPWLQSLPKPVGILVLGRGSAVVECCTENGISVPHDVAVLSSNYDELLCHTCFPAISGIISPTERIGHKAAELLQDLMSGKTVPEKTIYIPPTSIKERLSTNTLAVQDPQLVQVVEFIHAHALEPITLNDILKAVPMARRSLDRKFLKAFGRSPTDEIRRLRINKARHLLSETNMSMQMIAEASGYATYNYLTHVFKQMTGMTPSAFRKQFQR